MSHLDAQPLSYPIREIKIADDMEHERALLTTGRVSAAMAAQLSHTLESGALEISLDHDSESPRRVAKVLKQRINAERNGEDESAAPFGFVRDSELRRRDSLRRREALLRGKEGSRRRQKWENDRLLGNPAFNPPEPHDWEPRPTHCVQHVPYVLAPLWDMHYAKAAHNRKQKEPRSHQVPKELREKLKRAKGAKSMLQQLEEQVRSFVEEWEESKRLEADGWDQVEDTEACLSEEEVVFVGRKGRRPKHDRLEMDKLLLDSPVDDQHASFGRWLVHSLASYYNLRTWSITVGNPARREAYIGIPPSSELSQGLPRPLWVMV